MEKYFINCTIDVMSLTNIKYQVASYISNKPYAWYKYFAQSVWILITYLLPEITFEKIYCVRLFKLFRQNCP